MHFISALFKIVIIDLVLSGDNVVVIGMAAHRLPERQRRMAILCGGAAAIVLRISLTAIAAVLLRVSGLQIAGGLLLIWIGFRLLKQEEESHEGVKVAANMREAIVTILIADFVMSTDNVIAVAAASDEDNRLLLFGLLLSMPILMGLGSIVARLVNRFWWLSYAGTAVIAWTGSHMIFKDPIVAKRVVLMSSAVVYGTSGAVTAAVLALAHWVHRSGPSA